MKRVCEKLQEMRAKNIEGDKKNEIKGLVNHN